MSEIDVLPVKERPCREDTLAPLRGVEFRSPNGIRVAVISGYPDPDDAVWYALHQCYYEGFSLDDSLPKDPGGAIVRNLLKKKHFGPLEHVQLTLNIGGVSRALMAQLTRHRTGITFDIQSLRYTKVIGIDVDEQTFVIPPYLKAKGAPRVRERYSRSRIIEDPKRARQIFLEGYRRDLKEYEELVDLGVPAEDARYKLPEGLKINMVMSANARTFMHLFDMRLPPNAQWEITELCQVMLQIGKRWMPKTFAWYEEERAFKHMLAP